MSKRILLACVVLCGAAPLQAGEAKAQAAPATQAPAAQPAAVKVESDVIYVDMQQAMLQSKQGAEAQKVVEAEEKKYAEMAQAAQQEMVKTQQEMMKIKSEMEQKASMMSPEAQRAQEKKFRAQEKKLNDLQRDYQNNMGDWQNELRFIMQRETDAIIKDIEAAAKELGEKTGKKVIDIQTGRPLYLHENLNSTNQLMSVMDEQFTAKQKNKTAK